jgi:iron complex transport system permease protein
MNKTLKYLILLLSIVAVILISLSVGTTFISPLEILKLISTKSNLIDLDIIVSLRIPRIILALTVGASLSVSGVIFQSILKNPLADPFTIGVSSGAALGASIAIILHADNFYITVAAFLGSISTAYFVYLISRYKRFGSSYLILSGISLSFVLWSSVLLIFAFSASQDVHKAVLWLMGDLSIARYQVLWRIAGFSLIIILFSYIYHRQLNIISFGEEFAESSGVTTYDIRNLFWIAALLAALSVAVAGVIGFVGLIIPHVARSFFSSNHKQLLGVSAVCGGIFIVICDALSRTIASPYEIPIGIITGFFGGIFFLILMLKKGSK